MEGKLKSVRETSFNLNQSVAHFDTVREALRLSIAYGKQRLSESASKSLGHEKMMEG